MQYKMHKLTDQDIPGRLHSIPSPPKVLFSMGPVQELADLPAVAVVGSRKVTPYGTQITEQIVERLSQRGVVIVSGLALGVDAVAHQAALNHKGKTIAVLPAGLDNISPISNLPLAKQIIKKGGALVSEYEPHQPAYKQNFVARNRLVAGVANTVLITEAGQGSGALHTARFAAKQNKPVFAVPGPINSPMSKGTNQLLKDGAKVLTEAQDILEALSLNQKQIKTKQKIKKIELSDPTQALIVKLVQSGITDSHQLQRASKLAPDVFNQSLTMLELEGVITASGNSWQINT